MKNTRWDSIPKGKLGVATSACAYVSAWNDGRYNYGVRVLAHDRDRYFKKAWEEVCVSCAALGHDGVEIKLPSYFWGVCSQLRSRVIRQWFCELGFVNADYEINRSNWPYCRPPKFLLLPKGNRHFDLQPLKLV